LSTRRALHCKILPQLNLPILLNQSLRSALTPQRSYATITTPMTHKILTPIPLNIILIPNLSTLHNPHNTLKPRTQQTKRSISTTTPRPTRQLRSREPGILESGTSPPEKDAGTPRSETTGRAGGTASANVFLELAGFEVLVRA